jgi:alpha-tubulin suppressor-like RCC1 family protein
MLPHGPRAITRHHGLRVVATLALLVPLNDGTTSTDVPPAAVPLSSAVKVSAGISYTLAVRSDGTALSWGNNSNGQLGDGTTTPRLFPGPVACGAAAGDVAHCSAEGRLKGVSRVAAGNGISLALLDDGMVMAWGNQTAFNGNVNSATPVYVVCGAATGANCSGGRLTNARAISAAFSHGLVLLDDGSVVAWGTNNNGNLGNNQPAISSSIPVQVLGLGAGSGVTSIATGQNFSLALKDDGSVVAWGGNGSGALGDGTTTLRGAPVPVVCRTGDPIGSDSCSSAGTLSGVTAIGAGNAASYARLADGTVLSWGANQSGQLGDGTLAGRTRPGLVCAVGASAPCSVEAGNALQSSSAIAGSSQGNSGYALDRDGILLAWGSNTHGQLGDGTTVPRNVPAPVPNVQSAIAISLGDVHAVTLGVAGSALSWGNNNAGQLGNGTILASATPVQVSGLGSGSGVVALATGSQSSLALLADGSVVGWGQNSVGQIGDGTTTNRIAPVRVICRSGDVPGSATCSNGGTLHGVTGVSQNANYSLALLDDGTVLAWGNNANAQLGDGSTSSRSHPANVCAVGAVPPCSVAGGNVLTGVSAVAAGGSTAYALRSDGTVVAWGNNNQGFVGDGTTTRRAVPVAVKCRAGDLPGSAFCTSGGFLQGVTAIAAGGNSPYVLMTDGSVLAWALNLGAQLGDGTFTNRTTPVNVCAVGATAPCTPGNGNVLGGVTVIGRSAGSGFAVIGAGPTSTLVAWGLNSGGQLGDGTTIIRFTPVFVCAVGAAPPCSAGSGNALRGVKTVAGNASSYAVLENQAMLAWGPNSSGQLDDGTFASRSTPAEVSGLGAGSGVVAVDAGASFALALTSGGRVLAWGANDSGQLGDGTEYVANLSPSPVLLVDIDGDGVADLDDNCAEQANPDQANHDGDSGGDVCDADDDGDSLIDDLDNCPLVVNAAQTDTECDGRGDACDPLVPADCQATLSCHVVSYKNPGVRIAAANECARLATCAGDDCASACTALLGVLTNGAPASERQLAVDFCNAVIPGAVFQ